MEANTACLFFCHQRHCIKVNSSLCVFLFSFLACFLTHVIEICSYMQEAVKSLNSTLFNTVFLLYDKSKQLFITKCLSLTGPTDTIVTGHRGPTDPVATGHTGPTDPIVTGHRGPTDPVATGHTGPTGLVTGRKRPTDNIPTFRVQDILAAVSGSLSDNDL
jgi:hypothetical protein